jgi:hypothetical protein
MTLQEHYQKDKLTLIAMHALLCDCAEQWAFELAGSLSDICRQAQVNRTQVYERKAKLWEVLAEVEWPGSGRPVNAAPPPAPGYELREQVLHYRLAHPGAVVVHASGSTSYSDGFRRLVLDLADSWEWALEAFCQCVEIPHPTLMSWRRRDRAQPYAPPPMRAVPVLPDSATTACRTVVDDYARWEGSLREFLRYEAQRLRLAPNAIRRVLAITGMIASKAHEAPRYRGSTERQRPGDILVTDGKALEVVSTASGEISHYNWQGTVDQATACHTAVVITENESAEGVRQAYEYSCEFLGRAPGALIHDNKPIHEDRALRAAIEPHTAMIAATPGRPENNIDTYPFSSIL